MENQNNLQIIPIESGPVATFGYCIADIARQCSIVIDVPLESAEFFLTTTQKLGTPIKEIWLTHSHFDHVGDVVPLHSASKAPVFIHAADEYRLQDPAKNASFPLPFTIQGTSAHGYFTHGQVITIGGWIFEVRHTPGHTEGGVCFIDHTHNVAFVGDTLFEGSIGRTDLPGGNTNKLLESIRTQLFTLPDTMVVLPGHGTATTIGKERLYNPFFQ